MDRSRWPRRQRLGRAFYDRPTLEVARDLVGRHLVQRGPAGLVVVRIVEVEAYLGEGQDPASHAHRGRTPRNLNMFETPGRLYVYVSYGLHHCLNVVCESRGTAGAVLLRAAEPVEGVSILQLRRAGRRGAELSNGPGKLGQAMGAGIEWNGRDLVTDPELGLWPGEVPGRLMTTGRIGISQAIEWPFRFHDPHSAWVSRGRVAPLT